VRNVLTARYDVARGSQDRPTFAVQAATAAVPTNRTNSATATTAAPAPDTAGIANAFAAAVPMLKAADKQQVFHGLFADGGRAAPLAPVVSALWGAPNAAPSGSGTAPQKPAANGMLNLFRDLSVTGS
jgi:hypothetical protein